jgi:hypothetical protein
MANRSTLDRKAGRVPEIESDGRDLIFKLDIAESAWPVKLVIRCDADGEAWMSIDVPTPDEPPEEGH